MWWMFTGQKNKLVLFTINHKDYLYDRRDDKFYAVYNKNHLRPLYSGELADIWEELYKIRDKWLREYQNSKLKKYVF